jgi:hypothetical protein
VYKLKGQKRLDVSNVDMGESPSEKTFEVPIKNIGKGITKKSVDYPSIVKVADTAIPPVTESNKKGGNS